MTTKGLYCDIRLNDSERYSIDKPRDWNMRIPNEILDCVCFLGVNLAGGPNAHKFYSFGTGFFVGVEQDGHHFSYLVTAKHVVDEAERGGYGRLFARVNTQAGGTSNIELRENDAWIRWTNDAIDVAVLPLPNLDSKSFSNRYIPMKMFADNQKIAELGIGPGDDLFAVGLFVLKAGKQRNTPIVRTGIIAAMPLQSEPFTRKGGTYHAYLAEMRSIGGLSGSPVFVFLDQSRLYDARIPEGTHVVIACLGLIRGHWDLERELSDDVEVAADAEMGYSKGENLNTGIAVVTPIHYVIGILNSKEMQAMRADIIRAYDEKIEPTEDKVTVRPVTIDDSATGQSR